MSANKNYYIKIGGQLVPVTEEVYREYHKMGRRERYLESVIPLNGTFNYSERDTDEMSGEESIADTGTPPVEQIAINATMVERLYKCLDMLSDKERELVDALYFKGYSEREWSVKSGIPRKTLAYQRGKLLAKLKKLLDD